MPKKSFIKKRSLKKISLKKSRKVPYRIKRSYNKIEGGGFLDLFSKDPKKKERQKNKEIIKKIKYIYLGPELIQAIKDDKQLTSIYDCDEYGGEEKTVCTKDRINHRKLAQRAKELLNRIYKPSDKDDEKEKISPNALQKRNNEFIEILKDLYLMKSKTSLSLQKFLIDNNHGEGKLLYPIEAEYFQNIFYNKIENPDDKDKETNNKTRDFIQAVNAMQSADVQQGVFEWLFK